MQRNSAIFAFLASGNALEKVARPHSQGLALAQVFLFLLIKRRAKCGSGAVAHPIVAGSPYQPRHMELTFADCAATRRISG